ncbi:MAG: helix-turn-helix transcriptional regulator [Chlorobi bacterium]|jgi:AraC-like DNA-binding protein|nr:helix-turn-helix transcriptional regulator [Chlorobiota bacterium]
MSDAIAIKNMVCRRCIMAVENVLAEMGIAPVSVRLGEAVLPRPLSQQERRHLADRLAQLGFELLDDRQRIMVEHAKAAIIELLRSGDEEQLERVVWSRYLQQKLGVRYAMLSRLFSQVEGKTIERYIIEQKIELVKELLAYGELSLTEIAYRLGYSSVHHLSSQFKQVTGMTASQFRSLRQKPRRPLDQV